MAKKNRQDGGAAGKSKPIRIVNRKARYDYHILEVVECGIGLEGTEVKSLRAGQAKIDEAYARIEDGEVLLVGSTISPYEQAAAGMQHDPNRDRKLLVHRRQIGKLQSHASQKGRTLVPLALYFKRGWAKCELGIAVGKRFYDKRQELRERQQKLDVQREMSRHGRR